MISLKTTTLSANADETRAPSPAKTAAINRMRVSNLNVESGVTNRILARNASQEQGATGGRGRTSRSKGKSKSRKTALFHTVLTLTPYSYSLLSFRGSACECVPRHHHFPHLLCLGPGLVS